MANTTPMHNALTIKLANQLDDPLLAGADDGITSATDGLVFPASTLNAALGDAYTWLANLLVTKFGALRTSQECTGMVAAQVAIALGTAGATVNKDFVAALRLWKSGAGIFQLRNKNYFENADDIRLVLGYAIEGGKLYAYQLSGNAFVAATGAGTFYYIKNDRKDTTNGTDVAVNTAPDMTIESRWHELIIRRAAWRASMDKGNSEYIEKANAMLQEIDRILKELGL